MAVWVQPTLADLKLDIDQYPSVATSEQDAALQLDLDAANAFVLDQLGDRYNFTNDILTALPDVPHRVFLGTLRLAARWWTRRRSPDLLVSSAEFGSSRVPAIDSDIERLLGIGRFGGGWSA